MDALGFVVLIWRSFSNQWKLRDSWHGSTYLRIERGTEMLDPGFQCPFGLQEQRP